VILRLVGHIVRFMGDAQYTEWGERFYVPREGDMVVCADSGVTRRWQRRDHTLHALDEGEYPWVYSQFLNRWEPATIPTDVTFGEAYHAFHVEGQRYREQIRLERRRARQDKAWARAARR
jgi:hypothetical protein